MTQEELIQLGFDKISYSREVLDGEGYFDDPPYYFYAFTLDEVDIENNKIAILLGTELTGLSNEALSLADKKMKIEMHGFTESLNISASAAICCQSLSNKMRKSEINWKIDKSEEDEIILNWLRNTIKSSEEIEQRFFKKNSKL